MGFTQLGGGSTSMPALPIPLDFRLHHLPRGCPTSRGFRDVGLSTADTDEFWRALAEAYLLLENREKRGTHFLDADEDRGRP